MGIKNIFIVWYTDLGTPEGIGYAYIEGFDETEARENFSLAHDGVIIEEIEQLCEEDMVWLIS